MGIFSRFTTSRSGHRRTRSALEERQALPPNPEASGATISALGATHGIEVDIEFKPVEHPIEPLDDNDKPVLCPLPEPNILNDGRIWKERVSAAHVRRRSDLPLVKEGEVGGSEELADVRIQPAQLNRMILPSLSAPEHNILHLLEEFNASRI